MADQYDGSVIIDTELDTSGFEKGSDKLRQAMGGVTAALDGLADKAAHAFQEPIRAPEFEDFDDSGLESAIAEFEEHEREIAEATKQIFDGADSSKLVEEYDDAAKAADRLAQRQKALHQLMEERAADAYAENHAADEKTFESYARVIERNASAITDALSRIQHASEQGFRNTSQVLNFSSNIDAAEKRIATLKQAMQELGELQLLDETQQERYETMRAEIERIESDLRTNAGLINQESIEQARLNVLTAQQKVATAETARERRKAMSELMEAQRDLAAYANNSVTPAPDPTVVTSWERFGDIMKDVGETARNSLKSLGSGALNMIKRGFKSAVSGAKNLLTNLRRNNVGADGLVKKLTSLKTMLLGRVRRTFISFLFNSISDAFKELAKFDDRFDKAVSNLQNRTKELGANVMGALGGLLRQIEPYITALIDKASEAVKKVSALFAALRGESQVQVAVRQTQSYADSLRAATKEAKAAKTAQDKYNQTLTSYDEIHKLTDNNAGASDTNAGSEAEAELYQNVPVGSILRNMDETGKKIVDRFVQAVKDGDWRGAGSAIADCLNLGVQKLDEAIIKARDKVVTGAHSIAEALNGLTDGFDAYTLGKTIADGVELGLDAAYEFLTTYDFGKFGRRIADGVNGFAVNLNAEKVGRTIAAGINDAIDFGFELVTNIKWDTLGEKLGTTVNRIFKDIDWAKAAQTVGNGIAGLINSVASFLETVDAEEVGRALVTFLTNVPWADIAQAVWRLLGAAIGGVAGLLKGAFEAIAEKASNWGEHLFDAYGSEFNDAGEQVSKGIWNGIKAMFKNCAQKVKANIFDPFVKGFKKAFGIASPAKEMQPYGEYVGEGILEGVKGAFSSVSNWISTNIVEPFKRGFNTAFSVVGNTANALKAKGETIASGIKSGISSGWANVTTLLSEKAEGVKSFFTVDKFKKLGENVISGINDGLSEDGTLAEKVGKLKDRISESIDAEGLKGVGKNILHILGWGVDDDETYNNTIGKSISGLADRISDSLDAEKVRQIGKNIAWILDDGIEEYLSTTPSSKLNGIAADWVAAAKQGAVEKDYLAGPLRTVQEIASTIDEIGDSDVKVNVEADASAAATMLDTVADKLAAIAQIFQTINRSFTEFASVPLPAIVTGAYAPAGTRVTDISGSGLTEIKQLLGRFLDRAAELEERMAERPVRVDVHAEIDKREIARATAEVGVNTHNINNGNGGGW